MAVPHEVPLFPLDTVLFPGGPLLLRIFEPRYLDMVAERMRSEQPFGVCLIRDGQEAGEPAIPHEVGTFARIVDFQQYEDGLLGITALGEGRFRVRSLRTQPDQLVIGDVEPLSAEPGVSLSVAHANIPELVETLLERTGPLYADVPKRFDDPTWLGFRLAEVLPIPLARKQGFLELDNATLRLDQIADVLKVMAENAE
jgi:Lon protease-like protein